MIKKFLKLFKKRRPRRRILTCSGEHYDLKAIYDQVNQLYFESKLVLRIMWFGDKNSRPRTRIRLGSYNHRTELIKIHRVLDQAHVPHHFVSFIVYHEMLHHVLPPVETGRRRKIHHQEFLEKEKQFQEYALAKESAKKLKKTWFSSCN